MDLRSDFRASIFEDNFNSRFCRWTAKSGVGGQLGRSVGGQLGRSVEETVFAALRSSRAISDSIGDVAGVFTGDLVWSFSALALEELQGSRFL